MSLPDAIVTAKTGVKHHLRCLTALQKALAFEHTTNTILDCTSIEWFSGDENVCVHDLNS